MKICSKCKVEKELNKFDKDRSSKSGYRSSCRLCRKGPRKVYKDSVKGKLVAEKIHSNSKGYVVKKYQNGFELLFVYKSDGTCYLIEQDLSDRSYVTPQEKDKI